MTFSETITQPELDGWISGLLKSEEAACATKNSTVSLNHPNANYKEERLKATSGNAAFNVRFIRSSFNYDITALTRIQSKESNIAVPVIILIPVKEKNPALINNGYQVKKDLPEALLKTLQSSLQELKKDICNIIEAKVQECFDKQRTPVSSPDDYPLTKREKEILKKLLQGLVYKQIAGECFISRHTLNSHLKKIYRKLRVHSRAEAAAKFSGYSC